MVQLVRTSTASGIYRPKQIALSSSSDFTYQSSFDGEDGMHYVLRMYNEKNENLSLILTSEEVDKLVKFRQLTKGDSK